MTLHRLPGLHRVNGTAIQGSGRGSEELVQVVLHSLRFNSVFVLNGEIRDFLRIGGNLVRVFLPDMLSHGTNKANASRK